MPEPYASLVENGFSIKEKRLTSKSDDAEVQQQLDRVGARALAFAFRRGYTTPEQLSLIGKPSREGLMACAGKCAHNVEATCAECGYGFCGGGTDKGCKRYFQGAYGWNFICHLCRPKPSPATGTGAAASGIGAGAAVPAAAGSSLPVAAPAVPSVLPPPVAPAAVSPAVPYVGGGGAASAGAAGGGALIAPIPLRAGGGTTSVRGAGGVGGGGVPNPVQVPPPFSLMLHPTQQKRLASAPGATKKRRNSGSSGGAAAGGGSSGGGGNGGQYRPTTPIYCPPSPVSGGAAAAVGGGGGGGGGMGGQYRPTTPTSPPPPLVAGGGVPSAAAPQISLDLTQDEDEEEGGQAIAPPDDFPKEWSFDPNTYLKTTTVTLDLNSSEAMGVMRAFRDNVARGDAIVKSGGNYREARYVQEILNEPFAYKVNAVERVQNYLALGPYEAHRKMIEQRMKARKANEQISDPIEEIVYHGTDANSANSIIHSKFNRVRTHTTAYGRGIYFDVYGQLAQYHATDGGRNEGRVIVTRLLTGRIYQTNGSSTDVPNGFDCGGSTRTRAGWMRIAFDDAQALPIYIMHIERTPGSAAAAGPSRP